MWLERKRRRFLSRVRMKWNALKANGISLHKYISKERLYISRKLKALHDP
jgi:hypothetical protein